MTRLYACALLLAACAAPKDAKEVKVAEAATGLERRLDIDGLRVTHAHPDLTVPKLVERHLSTVGLIRPSRTEGDALVLLAEVPTPGYAVRAVIQPRPEQFSHVRVGLIALAPNGELRVEAAPWWAVDSLEIAAGGIATLQPPRRAPMDDLRFAKLRAQADKAARANLDPPLTREQYVKVPRRLGDSTDEYYTPPTGSPQLLK